MHFGNIENKLSSSSSPYIDSTCRQNEFAISAENLPFGVKSRTYYFSGEYRNSSAKLTRAVEEVEFRDNKGNTKTREIKISHRDITESEFAKSFA